MRSFRIVNPQTKTLSAKWLQSLHFFLIWILSPRQHWIVPSGNSHRKSQLHFQHRNTKRVSFENLFKMSAFVFKQKMLALESDLWCELLLITQMKWFYIPQRLQIVNLRSCLITRSNQTWMKGGRAWVQASHWSRQICLSNA